MKNLKWLLNSWDVHFAAMALIDLIRVKKISECFWNNKYGNSNLNQIFEINSLRQFMLGRSLFGATRAKHLLLKGLSNPLRVRGRFVAIRG
jgi:hypothetical protein